MKPPKPLLLVAQKLGPLRERVVFVGGMIRGLLTTDPAAAPMRPTDDVDLIVRGVKSYVEYRDFGDELRKLGFQEDSTEGAPMCRWVVEGVTADVMPIDPSVLGFTNVWYESAQRHTSTTNTTAGALHHLDAPHFCATKLEAFASRAGGDFYHHDLEDFIGLVDERSTLVDDIASGPAEVREFIVERVRQFIGMPKFLDSLDGHLAGDEVSQQRLPALIEKLQRISDLLPPVPVRRPHRSATARATPVSVSAGFAGQASAPPLPSPKSPTRIQVQSSNLNWVEYDAPSQKLLVQFHSGGTYRYSGVPEAVYHGLIDSFSKGRYFHVWIRKRYAFARVR